MVAAVWLLLTCTTLLINRIELLEIELFIDKVKLYKLYNNGISCPEKYVTSLQLIVL